MENEEVRLTLRLPGTLHKDLISRCSKTRRTLNQEILRLLENFVHSEEIAVVPKVSEKESRGHTA
jgi:hypothetical protein